MRSGPFDAAPCPGATLDDLDVAGMYRFIRVARTSRQFPLLEETRPQDLLRHLGLLKRGRLTNAAVMLFGRARQRFVISSKIECAHFHGTEVAKPIPFHRVYKGTVFELVDQAVDFVLSKIDRSVGTRERSVQAPVAYEIPEDVVTEAIVNAVAHRDHTDNSSVQVMLFADRLEVLNSGRLPPSLTVEKLRVAHQSLPANPLIAESMYLLRYIEKLGTGTVDMIRRCAEAGLPEPEFEAGAGFVTRIWRPTRDRMQQASPVRLATQEFIASGPLPTQEDGETTQGPDGTTQESGGMTDSVTTRDRILALLRSDPALTRVALAGRVGVSPDGVKYHLDKLRRAGRICRVGPTKKGRWEILE